jgi:hypothetical protein
MLSDASTLPTEPVNNFPKTSGTVVEPALRRFESCTQWCDILRAPDWREDVPRGVKTVLCSRVMVLCVIWSAVIDTVTDSVSFSQCSLWLCI